MGHLVQIQAADGHSFDAYVAQPQGKPRGAVVVLQEIFGVNHHIRAVADGYALAGYYVVAPATFHRVKSGVELGYTPDDMNAGFALKTAVEALPAPGVMADIQAAVNEAAKQSGGKVGVVGYCWGGLLTWRAAALVQGVSAAVPYYGGGVTTEAEAARKPLCPVMAHFGDKDHWIPLDTVEAFRRAQSGVEVHVYAADHGFNCNERGSYDEAAANTALERTLAFFGRHLG
ncbi:MAG: dienelactone hydrolase family protein [Limnohabitans sp.]|jgi:carboxymethylenebutenolidase|nr:dienelactone hydrolase family protein [Limnohabitans sp.]